MLTDSANQSRGPEVALKDLPGILANAITEGIKYGFSGKRIASKCLQAQHSSCVRCSKCGIESRVLFLSREALLNLHAAAKRMRPEEAEAKIAETFRRFRLVCTKCGAVGRLSSHSAHGAEAPPAGVRPALAG